MNPPRYRAIRNTSRETYRKSLISMKYLLLCVFRYQTHVLSQIDRKTSPVDCKSFFSLLISLSSSLSNSLSHDDVPAEKLEKFFRKKKSKLRSRVVKRIVLDETGNDSVILNVRKPRSIVKEKRAQRRRSRSQSADETLVRFLPGNFSSRSSHSLQTNRHPHSHHTPFYLF